MHIQVQMVSILGITGAIIKALDPQPGWIKARFPMVALVREIERPQKNLKVKAYNYLDVYMCCGFSIATLCLLSSAFSQIKEAGSITGEIASSSGTWVSHLSSLRNPIYLLMYIKSH